MHKPYYLLSIHAPAQKEFPANGAPGGHAAGGWPLPAACGKTFASDLKHWLSLVYPVGASRTRTEAPPYTVRAAAPLRRFAVTPSAVPRRPPLRRAVAGCTAGEPRTVALCTGRRDKRRRGTLCTTPEECAGVTGRRGVESTSLWRHVSVTAAARSTCDGQSSGAVE